MKKLYFTPQSIHAEARAMLDEIAPFSHRAIAFIPRNSLLLVIDMQRYFFDSASHAYIPSADAILPNIQSLISAYTKASLPIVCTRHMDIPNSPMYRWWHDGIVRDDPRSAFIDTLDTSHAIVVEKHSYDAFFETELHDLLKHRTIKQIVLCGVMTHLCCDTTARSAFIRGFDVFFPVDATATYTRALHCGTLHNLAHGCATITRCDALIRDVECLV